MHEIFSIQFFSQHHTNQKSTLEDIVKDIYLFLDLLKLLLEFFSKLETGNHGLVMPNCCFLIIIQNGATFYSCFVFIELALSRKTMKSLFNPLYRSLPALDNKQNIYQTATVKYLWAVSNRKPSLVQNNGITIADVLVRFNIQKMTFSTFTALFL